MDMPNSEIAQKFNQVADLLEIGGANPFRVRAYRQAARTLLDLPENVADTVHQHGDLTLLPGIGKDLSSKIAEIVETGHLDLLDQIEKKTPMILCDLLRIPTLGPKRVQLLSRNFRINSLADLQKLAEDRRLLGIRGFGEKTRRAILDGLRKIQSPDRSRLKLMEAEQIAGSLLRYLRRNALIQKSVVAGSFRRRQETVGDLDILVTADNGPKAIKYFLKFPAIAKVLSHGSTRSSVILRTGVQVDLRVVPQESYGAALLYFTGSKAHNIALRSLARKNGMKINEYGIFKGSRRFASTREAEIYRALKLPYIEPELRENQGEIEAALKWRLPILVKQDDICGDLHIHTKATDGTSSIEDMALAAQRLGYSYIAITDHSKRVTVAHGLNENELLKQIHEIDRLNKKFKDFTILKSVEVDILEDGSLDLSDHVLAQLDFTVCAIHSQLNLSKERQTERILRAMENRYFDIFAHPTGRLIGEREPSEIDFEKVIAAAAQLGRCLEINCQPARLDLLDQHCRLAKELNVKIAISTDAHSPAQLKYVKYGIGQARRGWLGKNDIVNTLSLENLKVLFSVQRKLWLKSEESQTTSSLGRS